MTAGTSIEFRQLQTTLIDPLAPRVGTIVTKTRLEARSDGRYPHGTDLDGRDHLSVKHPATMPSTMTPKLNSPGRQSKGGTAGGQASS
jgi:hypothetical protein